MEKGKVSGIIKFPGWITSFDLQGRKMNVRTRVSRTPTEAEKRAISDAIEYLTLTLSMLSEQVDMSEAEGHKGAKSVSDVLLSEKEKSAFEDFVKNLAKSFEEKNEKKRNGPFGDFFGR